MLRPLKETDFWSALRLYRSFSTRAEAIAEIANLNIGDFRVRFLKQIFVDEAFENEGNIASLYHEINQYPSIFGNTQLKKIAKKAKQEAEYLLLTHDNSMVEAGFWEHTKIPGVEITVEKCGDNLPKNGVHLFHCGIGAGKTSNVLLPEARKIKGNHGDDRALIVVPNEKRVEEIAAELGWAHYHTYGTTTADVKKAIKTHNQLVICAASLRRIVEDGEFIPYRQIFVDEITEIFKYAEKHGSGDKSDEQWWVSLQALFKISAWAYRFLAFTADAPSGFVISTMEKLAREYNRAAYYYKTMESYAQYQTYGMLDSEEDLIWKIAKLLNDGKSAWVYCDFSDHKGQLSKFANTLKKLCPDKKIEWFDAPKIKESIMGAPIREMGVVEYIKHKRREGELDCFIASPFAKSQYSILWDKEEEDLVFDFSAACLKHANINSPQDGDQGLGRSRQTKSKFFYIAEAGAGASTVRKDAGEKILRDKFGKTVDLSTAERWEKVYWHCWMTAQQYQHANRASRKWLFRLLVEGRGAKVVEPKEKTFRNNAELNKYLKVAEEVNKETLAMKRGHALENDTTLRLKRLAKAYQRKDLGWGIIPHNDYDAEQLEKALMIDGYTADQVYLILSSDEDYRRMVDKGFIESAWEITGYLLDLILLDLIESTTIRTQTNFFDWYLNGDDSTWFVLPEEKHNELKLGLENNFDRVKATLNPPITIGGTVAGFLKIVGDCIGLDLILKVEKEERTQWRSQLLYQYQRQYGGKFPKSLTSWSQRYEKIAELLKPRLNERNFVPTYEERRFLDTLPDVCRVTKKSLVSREVVNVYRHWLLTTSENGGNPPSRLVLEDPESIEEAIFS